MKIKLATFWNETRSSYWLWPGLMTAGAILLSHITVAIDAALPRTPTLSFFRIYGGGVEGARAVLSTVVGSTITVAGVVFSVVIVALTLASSQFGSRVLRMFLRDTIDQVALGTFIATFVYCLLVLRTVRVDHGGEEFVPRISVTIGLIMTLVSMAVLIQFISHVATSLQASSVIATIAAELDRTVDHEYPDPATGGHSVAAQPAVQGAEHLFEVATHPVYSSACGYIQVIDYGDLLGLAVAKDILIRVVQRPGEYVVEGDLLALIPSGFEEAAGLEGAARQAFVLGIDRTPEQDVEFPVNQLVQLGLRALSPAINDPVTAMMVMDRLGAALCRMARRAELSPIVLDHLGRPRLLLARARLANVIETAFSQLRQCGRGSLEVSVTLLAHLERIAERTTELDARQVLLDQATLIDSAAQSGIPEEGDRQRVRRRFEQLARRLESSRLM